METTRTEGGESMGVSWNRSGSSPEISSVKASWYAFRKLDREPLKEPSPPASQSSSNMGRNQERTSLERDGSQDGLSGSAMAIGEAVGVALPGGRGRARGR